jgi:flagellar motor protein MotB
MKVLTTLGIAALFLSFGTIAPAFAQHEQEEAKPESNHQQEHAQQPQQQHAQQPQQQHAQQPQQQHAQQPQQQHAQQPPQQHAQQSQQQHAQQSQQQHAQQSQQAMQQHKQQQANQQGIQQQTHHTQEQQNVQQAAWQGHRSENWQSDHRTWQQRGGYNGYRIPANHYNGHFGSSHEFVIFSQPYMVIGGFPRFQYGGYWFSLVDPWPNSWASNWYETDDIYVSYADNGYYIYDRRYPGVGIAVSVSL